MLALCRGAGLPAPRVNGRVGDPEVDFLWPANQLVVETDGFQAHRSRAAFERDRARDVVLESAGYRVRRFTHRQLTEQAGWVVAAIRAGLSETVR